VRERIGQGRAWDRSAAALVLVAFLGLMALVFGRAAAGLLGASLGVLGAIVFATFGYLAWTRRVRHGALEVDGHGLHVGGELVAPRDRIMHAWVQPHGAERLPTVWIEGPGLRLEVESSALGVAPCRALVRALGFAPDAKAMRFPLLAGVVIVGADGVWVDPGDAPPTFRTWATLRTLHDRGDELVLAGSEGELAILTRGMDATQRAALVERIQAVLEDRDVAGETPSEERAALAPVVLRGARSVEAWVAELEEAGKGAGYRGFALDEEALARAALDPRAAPELRAGAALALRARASDEQRARLRVAAAATAVPLVRVALAAAADPEHEEAELARRLEHPDDSA
jgi:hypothetical protein